MKQFITGSFPRRFFFGEKEKGAIGISHHIQRASNHQTILNIIQHSLPQEGTLFHSPDGSIHMQVSDSYFDYLLPLVEENIFSPAFELCRSTTLVFTPQEAKELDFASSYPFEVKGCYGIEPWDREDVAKVWFLLLHSPSLENLRLQSGFSPWLRDQPFYLLMGIEKFYHSFENVIKMQ